MPLHTPGDRMNERDLYPPIAPYETGTLAVDPPHQLYWEQSGNPAGQPVIFLHGGPGAGASADHRRFFDPARYRVVIFDQRGAGRSRPLGELTDNTTQHLIADIERLRVLLGIERWVVFGGSWGSTLALAYAQAHPQRAKALVLRGIFLGRPAELDWFLRDMRFVFPEHWSAFAGFLPPAERADILSSYYRRLTDPDPAVHMPAARAWSRYEGACSTLMPNPQTVQHFAQEQLALGLARMEAHYFIHRLFLAENQLLEEIDRIRHIPAVVVQGRYDMVCPAVSADDLRRAWPEAEYHIVPDAGHSAMEPGTRRRLVAACDRFAAVP
jgi:proline iminopeptidase